MSKTYSINAYAAVFVHLLQKDRRKAGYITKSRLLLVNAR